MLQRIGHRLLRDAIQMGRNEDISQLNRAAADKRAVDRMDVAETVGQFLKSRHEPARINFDGNETT